MYFNDAKITLTIQYNSSVRTITMCGLIKLNQTNVIFIKSAVTHI